MIPAVLLLTPALMAGSGTPDPSDSLLRARRPWRVIVLQATPATAPDYEFVSSFATGLIAANQTVTVHRLALSGPDPGEGPAADLWLGAPRPDLLLLRGDSAFRQFLAGEGTLFPGTPVVFSGIGPDQIEGVSLPERMTGVLTANGPATLYQSARMLQPDLQHMMLIYGNDPDDLYQARRARAFLTGHGDQVSVTLRPLAAPQLAGELARARQTTAVVLYLRTADTYPSDPAVFRTVREVARASGAPIYTPHPALLGTGVAGVLRADPADDGEAAASLASGMLGHAAAAPVPEIGVMEPAWEFDWRALSRWRLDPSRLPFGTVTRYQPEPGGRIPGWSLAVLIGLCLVQVGMIIRMKRFLQRERTRNLESERLHTDLAHATRVAMIGELSLSIASEINQPLAAIRANADAARRLLDRQLPDVSEVRAILSDIKESDTRASAIVNRMRTLLKKGDPARREVLLNSVVEDAVGLISGLAATRRVQLKSELQPDLPPVFADQVQLEQVVINLLLNALDAIEDRTTGSDDNRVVLRTHRLDGQVVLNVQDTGPGLSSQVRGELFHPRVPGKPHRLGVGLSVCRSILEAHGGGIYGDNAPAGGAIFTVFLPVAGQTRLADAS